MEPTRHSATVFRLIQVYGECAGATKDPRYD